MSASLAGPCILDTRDTAGSRAAAHPAGWLSETMLCSPSSNPDHAPCAGAEQGPVQRHPCQARHLGLRPGAQPALALGARLAGGRDARSRLHARHHGLQHAHKGASSDALVVFQAFRAPPSCRTETRALSLPACCCCLFTAQSPPHSAAQRHDLPACKLWCLTCVFTDVGLALCRACALRWETTCVWRVQAREGSKGYPASDMLAAAVALDPACCLSECSKRCAVNCTDRPGRCTFEAGPGVQLVTALDMDRVRTLLQQALHFGQDRQG